MKIAINRCYGGFGLSKEALKWLGCDVDWCDQYCHRSDPRLIACIEALGEAANGTYAELTVVEIPDGIDWAIEEYDGMEWVSEAHRTWS